MSDYTLLATQLKPFLCLDKMRVGSKYDGGYVIPSKALMDSDCLLSFGVSTNIDFEKDYSELNQSCEIFMYDPFIGIDKDFIRLFNRVVGITTPVVKTKIVLADNPNYEQKKKSLLIEIINRIFHWVQFYKFISKKKIHFNKIGLRNYCDEVFTNFATLFTNPVIKSKQSVVLKIDIEGDEYPTFNDLLPHLNAVSVILYEFHDVKDNFNKLLEIIEKLKRYEFYLIHTHGNNSDILIEGTTIPNTLELSFCRKEYCIPTEIDSVEYPVTNLDNPCNPAKVDYSLEFLK